MIKTDENGRQQLKLLRDNVFQDNSQPEPQMHKARKVFQFRMHILAEEFSQKTNLEIALHILIFRELLKLNHLAGLLYGKVEQLHLAQSPASGLFEMYLDKIEYPPLDILQQNHYPQISIKKLLLEQNVINIMEQNAIPYPEETSQFYDLLSIIEVNIIAHFYGLSPPNMFSKLQGLSLLCDESSITMVQGKF